MNGFIESPEKYIELTDAQISKLKKLSIVDLSKDKKVDYVISDILCFIFMIRWFLIIPCKRP